VSRLSPELKHLLDRMFEVKQVRSEALQMFHLKFSNRLPPLPVS
jgi:hypothetical protein